MEVKNILPPNVGFLEIKLDKIIIDYLWKIIEIAKSNNIDYKNKLAGNISSSFVLNDQDSFFYKKVCVPLVNFYREKNNDGKDPVQTNTLTSSKTQLILNQFWVNYQYETEFNPYHDHSGAYSFAIWLKIPYDCKKQHQLPQFNGIKDLNKKAGYFQFEYIDTLGVIRNLSYSLSPEYEGTMLFFPAKLRHCVYPFYQTGEPRISIAGNLIYSSA